MKKFVIRLAPLALCTAFILSGCNTGFLERIAEIDAGSAAASSTAVSTAGAVDMGGTVQGTLSGTRGTDLSLNGDELEIKRLSRESEASMGESGVVTVFVYMCGSDLESDQNSATYDLEEMREATAEQSKLRFVVEADGTRMWNNEYCINNSKTRLLVSGGNITVVYSGDSTNMGDPLTLSDFLNWAVKSYPSQYMSLILWDHGGGSINGVCFDENYYDDSLSLEEIDTALASVYGQMTDRFEFIGCDACTMATVELANILVPYARYMICTQDLEISYGWDYTAFAKAVSANALSGDKMGKYLCDSYYSSCISIGVFNTVTMSVVDLSKIDSFLQSFNEYSKDVYSAASGDKLNDFMKAARSVLNFGGNNKSEGYTNMIDLKSLISATSSYSESSSAAIKLFDDCIVYTKSSLDMKSAGGMSIYYPLSIEGSEELDIFRNISISPYYLSLADLCAFNGSYSGGFDGWLGDDSGFWNDDWEYSFGYDNSGHEYSSTIAFEEEPHLDSEGYFTFRLTDESLYQLDTVYCYIYMYYYDEDENLEYVLDLGTDDYVDIDWYTGTVKDNFNGYWFALPDGQPLCAYLYDVYYNEDSGEYYNLYTSPVYINDEFTYLHIKQSYGYDEMTTEIIGAWDGISEYGSVSRDIYQLKAGDIITPCYFAFELESGYDTDFYGDDYIYTGNAEIGEDMLYSGYYYYGYEIYDLYGNVEYTDTVLFEVGEDGNIYFYND